MSRCLNLAFIAAVAVLPLSVIAEDFEDADENPWVTDATQFSCPAKVTIGEVITLRKQAGDWPDQLGLKLPNGDFMGLVMDDSRPEAKQLMTRKALGAARTIHLDPKTVTGIGWTGEVARNIKAFHSLGTYTFSLSGNMESDEGGYICKTTIIAAK